MIELGNRVELQAALLARERFSPNAPPPLGQPLGPQEAFSWTAAQRVSPEEQKALSEAEARRSRRAGPVMSWTRISVPVPLSQRRAEEADTRQAQAAQEEFVLELKTEQLMIRREIDFKNAGHPWPFTTKGFPIWNTSSMVASYLHRICIESRNTMQIFS